MGGFRNGVFAAGLLAILSGCGQDAEPIPFRLGQTIPLGALELEIVSFEAVPQVHAPISTLRTAPEDKAWALHVRWSGLLSLQGMEREVFLEKFLEKQLSVRDMDGDSYRPVGAMARWIYRQPTVPPSSADHNWVVVFHTPEVSRDFTLVIKNPKRPEGQPAVVSVALDKNA
jgi:hypothetical protein